jgi:uracil-DNA glycosylase
MNLDAPTLRLYGLSWCEWLRDAGAEDLVADTLHDYRKKAPVVPPPSITTPPAPERLEPSKDTQHAESVAQAHRLAQQATTLDALVEAIRSFDGCALKRTATHTVIADGNPEARIMILGEAPEAEEDKQGIPFCGASGKLLDAMLASIGLNRAEHVYLTTTLFWRPPANRPPTANELAICAPLVQRHIALHQPELLLLMGGVAAQSILSSNQGIMRLRGTLHHYTCAQTGRTIPALATFHPSFLLRQPIQKRQSWRDMLMLKGLL